MAAGPAQIESLRRFILEEIYIAFGLPPGSWLRRALAPVFWLPTRRFARMAADVDEQVARGGLREAASQVLPRFVRRYQFCGAERVPAQGPLVIAANHPGAADSLGILASLPRDDLHVVVSGIPFLRGLPHAGRHFLYATPDPHQRMLVFRAMLRHLEGGGSLLLFARQDVEPDPALMPGAAEALERWSSSVALCMQHVPSARLVVAITSGVLASGWLRSPIIRLREEAIPQQKLAEFLQVSQQMLLGGDFGLTPRLTYAGPWSLADLGAGGSSAAVMEAVIERAKGALQEHLSGMGCRGEEYGQV